MLDVAFLVGETFYYGPSNGFTEEEWRRLRDPLYKPRLPIRGTGRLLARDAILDRDELHKYYASVLAAANSRRKEVKGGDPEFWLRVVAWDAERELLSCAWHDTAKEAEEILSCLSSSKDGELFWDIEQGWELHVTGQGDFVHVLEGDASCGEVRTHFSCDRHVIAAQAQSACANLRDLVSWLSRQFGKNYWENEARA